MNINPMWRRILTTLAVGALVLVPQVRTTQAAPLVRLYQVTDLGTLGGTYSIGFGVNIRGQVTGFAQNAAGDTRAFLWQNGAMRDLGTLAGYTPGFGSEGHGINAQGDVVGGSDTPLSFHAFLARNGTMSDLGTLGGDTSIAVGVNLFGQVAGASDIATLDPATGNQEQRAFLWRNGVMSDLGVLGTGTNSAALAINDFGQVVGNSNINTSFDPEAGGPDFHAFLSQHGVMTDLGTTGGTSSLAWSINDRGQVAGWSKTATIDPSNAACGNPPTNHELQAALWQHGTASALSPFPGDTDSIAFGINNLGQVVGRSGTGCTNSGAALWEHGTVVSLNTVIPASSGWFLQRARAINDRGQILGEGTSPNNELHAFLLTPAGFGTPHDPDHQAQANTSQAAQSTSDATDISHDLRSLRGKAHR